MARERGARGGEEKVPEPEILPLMNVILMLILALITMSSLLPLGFLSSEAQKLSKGGAGAAADEPEKKPLNLIVFITNNGFNISVRGGVSMGGVDPANPSRKLALIPNIPGRDGNPEFDYQKLQEKLTEVKKLDENEQAMTITADPEVEFDVVIQTMDATRFDLTRGRSFRKYHLLRELWASNQNVDVWEF